MRERALLTRLRLDVSSLPDSDAKRLLVQELEFAAAELERGDANYAHELRTACEPKLRALRQQSRLAWLWPASSIGVLLLGVATYTAIVALIAPCVVVVSSLESGSTNAFTSAAEALGLMPVFTTVRSLGIRPTSYLWGIWGAAGAVVSMVKRFDQIDQQRGPSWKLFAQGLFNPIVGSLVAVVTCAFVYHGDQLNILKPVPAVVVAFFSGFSERLLHRIDSLLGPGQTLERK